MNSRLARNPDKFTNILVRRDSSGSDGIYYVFDPTEDAEYAIHG